MLTNEMAHKLLRFGIIALTAMCFLTVMKVNTRLAQQLYFSLMIMVLFGFLVKNVWLTAFLAWTVFLFIFFKHSTGNVYVQNVFFGCVLFFLTKISFKKKDISLFINAVLWVLCLNLIYGIVQVCWLDFVFLGRESISGGIQVEALKMAGGKINFAGALPYGKCPAPMGFMANTNHMATFVALCVPLLASKPHKWSIYAGGLLFIPLFYLHCSSAFIAGGLAYLFVLFFKVRRRAWIGVICVCIALCGVFFTKFDTIGVERLSQWKLVLYDAKIHPIVGWGLDSFRKVTEKKKHLYVTKYEKTKDGESIQWWDNPHNLYISLVFEWGIVAILLLIGYLRQCVLRFNRSVATPNLLAISGFMVAFFIVSMGQFPIFLARMAVIIVPILALYDVEVT